MMTSLAPSLIKWVIRPASPNSTRRTLGSLVGKVRSGVVGMVDDFRHGLDEAIECRTCEPAHLLQRPAAQFGPIGHRRSLAAAARSAQSGIASVTGTVVAVPARAAVSSS